MARSMGWTLKRIEVHLEDLKAQLGAVRVDFAEDGSAARLIAISGRTRGTSSFDGVVHFVAPLTLDDP